MRCVILNWVNVLLPWEVRSLIRRITASFATLSPCLYKSELIMPEITNFTSVRLLIGQVMPDALMEISAQTKGRQDNAEMIPNNSIK